MKYLDIARNHEKQPIKMIGKMANRHGLIAGATGTGKSITLRKIAECFSSEGVPVFLVDVKGDFSGLVKKGEAIGKVGDKIQEFNLDHHYFQDFPVAFWDVYGQLGIPLRVKVSSMGATLLSKLLGLNQNQEGLLNLAFKVADDNGWLIIDLKDLRALLKHVAEHASEYQKIYGNISSASVGAIQRQLLALEQEGGHLLFGEPDIQLVDFLKTNGNQGVINILAGDKLMRSPKTFSALLLWLLAEIFAEFPECGDLELPKFVMFFDEAHLLFDNTSSELVEQVVRLIRSKGVGVYFCTQSPLDIPQNILGQLGNRVQHALRAFTPKDQKAVKAAAETFRPNPSLNVVETISILGVGEALISFLDEKGMPTPVEYAYILPPSSRLPPISKYEMEKIIANDVNYEKYKHVIDNYSSFEALLAEEKEKFSQKEQLVHHKNPSARDNRFSQPEEKPGLIIAFFRGLLGIRKHTNAGLGYDVSNQLGKEMKRNLTRNINRTIMGIIKKR